MNDKYQKKAMTEKAKKQPNQEHALTGYQDTKVKINTENTRNL